MAEKEKKKKAISEYEKMATDPNKGFYFSFLNGLFFVENFVHFVFVGPNLVIVWANFYCSYFEFLISCLRGSKAIFGGHDYFCD